MSLKYSVLLSVLGQLKDRFSTYQEKRSLEERFGMAARVEGIEGVELTYPDDLYDVSFTKELLTRHGLRNSAVNVNLKGDPRWHGGALTALDERTRKEAIEWLRHGMDIAAELGSSLVTVCPLADGYNHPFEVDYGLAWEAFVACIQSAADHSPDVRLSLEYKRNEPRAHVILDNAGKALYACTEIGRSNVGITVDMGHALVAGESFAESLSLVANAKKLYLVHSNDNNRLWDWDLIPGSVNFWDLVEGAYWLGVAGYDGWIALDVFPGTYDAVGIMATSLRMARLAEDVVARVGPDRLDQSIRTGELLQTMALFQSYLEGRSRAVSS